MKPPIVSITVVSLVLMLSPLSGQAFVNGDFESGNSGFTSDYQFAAGNSTEGQYHVRSDPKAWNGQFADYGDHTSGTGNMLVVNGATSGDPAVWRQTITLAPNTSYRFLAWTGTAVSGGPAQLFLKVNGSQVGPSFVLPASSGEWVLWMQPWTSTSEVDYAFEIVNSNTSTFPNDFYLDDIGIVAMPIKLSAMVTVGGTNLVWPADPKWSLYTSDTMLPESWSLVTSVPVTSAGMNSLVFPIVGPRAFFRLQDSP